VEEEERKRHSHIISSFNHAEQEGVFNLITALVLVNYSDEEAGPLLQQTCGIVAGEGNAERSLVRYRM
jgi:hypothetical protein